MEGRKLTYACKLLCVELHTRRNAESANNHGVRIFPILQYNPDFVHIKYTSNMAACYDHDVNDKLHHIYRIVPKLAHFYVL